MKQLLVALSTLLSTLLLAQSGMVACEGCNSLNISYKSVGPSDYVVTGHTLAATTVEAIFAILTDIPHYTSWMDGCTESQLLQRFDDSTGIYRMVVHVPFPFKDREMIMRYSFRRTASGVCVEQECQPSYLPVDGRYERVTRYRSVWKATAAAGGVRLSFVIAMGGPKNMGRFLCNRAFCGIIGMTFANLVALSEKQVGDADSGHNAGEVGD